MPSSSPWWTCFSCMNSRDGNEINSLDYSHNCLQDVPPEIFQYERTLEELHLNSNRIADLPPQLFHCKELKTLYLNDNEIASIPSAINSLINLQKIDLSRNSFTTIGENVKCKNLQFLDLSVNNLERLPDAITSFLSLQELYLNDTFLEFLPANFGRLVNLRILELRDNNLITLPKSISRLINLTRIDIGNNEFTELPEVIGHLSNLTELWIDGNRIRRISSNIGNLKKLIHFEASNNLLTHLPNEISNWEKLQEFSISANELEHIPFSIGMIKSLISLKCDENQLQELPESISQLENLEELMISHNDLFRLPPSIGFLRKLRFLTGDENLIRQLPNEICSCTSLTILSVVGNKLTELPPDIGHLTNLRVINIVNNFISYLPVSILNLTQLTALWISDNQSQPLVQLQKEQDKEQNYYLTCFMLPQVGCSTVNEADYMLKEKQEQQLHKTKVQKYSNSNASVTTTTEATTITPSSSAKPTESTETPVLGESSKRRICFASDPVVNNIEQTSRLMRSPTPYPKELRVLAKYAKNIQKSDNSNALDYSDEIQDIKRPNSLSLEIKEARVTTNSLRLNDAGSTSVIDNNIVTPAGTATLINSSQNSNKLYDYDDQQKNQQIFDYIERTPLLSEDNSSHSSLSKRTGDANNQHQLLLQQHPSVLKRDVSCNNIQTPLLLLNGNGGAGVGSSDDVIDSAVGGGDDLPSSYYSKQGNHESNQQFDYENFSNYSDSTNGYDLLNKNQSNDTIRFNQYGVQYNKNLRTSPMNLNYTNFNNIHHIMLPLTETNNYSKSFNEGNNNEQEIYNQQMQYSNRSPTCPQNLHYPYIIESSMNKSELLNNNQINGYLINDVQQSQQYQLQQQQQQLLLQQHQQQLIENHQQQQHIQSLSNQQPEYRLSYGSDGNNGFDQQSLGQNENAALLRQPPPYHIAKAYTKKSKQDLLIYDSYRNKTKSVNINQCNNTINNNNMDSINYKNNDQLEDNDNYQNEQKIPPNNNHRSSPIYNENLNRTHNHLIDNNINNNINYNSSSSNCSNTDSTSPVKVPTNQQLSPSKSNWVFGLHKNPTVKQLSFPKVGDLGFTIAEHPNQGIYIKDVIIHSPAFGLIQKLDKVLDVDGIDFTKISLNEALTVLSNSGPIINIMVSRF